MNSEIMSDLKKEYYLRINDGTPIPPAYVDVLGYQSYGLTDPDGGHLCALEGLSKIKSAIVKHEIGVFFFGARFEDVSNEI